MNNIALTNDKNYWSKTEDIKTTVINKVSLVPSMRGINQTIKSGGIGLFKRNNIKNTVNIQNLRAHALLDDIRKYPLNTMGDGAES